MNHKIIGRILMRNIFILVYSVILGALIKTLNFAGIFLWIGFGIVILIFIPVYENVKKRNIRNHIKTNPHSPVININKAGWREIEEIPYITRVTAKKAVWLRNHSGLYLSKEDFFEKLGIRDELQIRRISPLIFL